MLAEATSRHVHSVFISANFLEGKGRVLRVEGEMGKEELSRKKLGTREGWSLQARKPRPGKAEAASQGSLAREQLPEASSAGDSAQLGMRSTYAVSLLTLDLGPGHTSLPLLN